MLFSLIGCSKPSVYTNEKTTLDGLGVSFNSKLIDQLKLGNKDIAALIIGASEGREYNNNTYDFEIYRYTSSTKEKMNEVFKTMTQHCKKSFLKGYFLVCDQSESASVENLLEVVDGKNLKIIENPVKKSEISPAVDAAPVAAPAADAAPVAAPAADAAAVAAPAADAAAVAAPAADATPAPDVDASFTAILTCGMGAGGGHEHINILACFADSDGADTNLELTNGDKYGLYKAYNLSRVGVEQRDGFHIKLDKHFSIQAQNSSDTLILGIKVIGDKTGKIYYQKQVSQFGVITVKN